MRATDTAAIRALLHPDAHLFVPLETQGHPSVRTTTVSDFITQVAGAGTRLDEQSRDPEVRVDGNLAAVWTYYDFHRGDQFSHCGTDAFHLARAENGWIIVDIAYTVRPSPCRK